MKIASPAFGNNQPIPNNYTVKGAAISPPLAIQNVPDGTQSLALIMHDPDAPRGDFVHWLVWNIPPAIAEWPEHSVPAGAQEGTSDYGRPGYGPPAPPSGTHRYVFDLYALDAPLSLAPGATREQLMAVMNGHILATSQLIGTVSA